MAVLHNITITILSDGYTLFAMSMISSAPSTMLGIAYGLKHRQPQTSPLMNPYYKLLQYIITCRVTKYFSECLHLRIKGVESNINSCLIKMSISE